MNAYHIFLPCKRDSWRDDLVCLICAPVFCARVAIRGTRRSQLISDMAPRIVSWLHSALYLTAPYSIPLHGLPPRMHICLFCGQACAARSYSVKRVLLVRCLTSTLQVMVGGMAAASTFPKRVYISFFRHGESKWRRCLRSWGIEYRRAELSMHEKRKLCCCIDARDSARVRLSATGSANRVNLCPRRWLPKSYACPNIAGAAFKRRQIGSILAVESFQKNPQ